jgi:integrase
MSLSNKDKSFNESILNEFKSLKDPTDKQKLALADKTMNHYKNNYSNPRTVTIKSSMTKKYFKNKLTDQYFILNLVPDKDITKKVKELNQTKLKSTKFIKLSKLSIDKMIKDYYLSDDIVKLGAYIFINTGRRMKEILNGSFKTCPREPKCILFKGILKKRMIKKHDSFIKIKVIDNKSKVLRSIRKFNKLLINKNKNSIQNKLQKGFKSLEVPNLSSHLFRVIYANYMFKYNNPENIIYNEFIRQRLNHTGLETSINYSSIEIN